jgi:ribosomal protein S25
MSDDTAQTEDSTQFTDSTPATVPSEATQASASEVTLPPVKDDNLSQNVQESQPIETSQTAQTGEISPALEPNQEQNPAPETSTTPPETGTAQTVVNEPLEKPSEPNTSEPIFSPTPTPISAEPISQPKSLARQLIAKAREAIQNRKRKKIDRILDLFAKRTNITNNQVADFLHVSDATATRYLQVLENENKIKQVGKTGKGVKYEKI